MWNPSTSDCECNKACTIDKYLDSKNCSCEERQIGKLVLECKDEMLKTPETLLNDKKIRDKKLPYSHDFIGNYMPVIIGIVSIGCYYYYTKDWIKKEHVLSC